MTPARRNTGPVTFLVDAVERRLEHLLEVETWHKISPTSQLCCSRFMSCCRRLVVFVAPIFMSALEFARSIARNRIRSAVAAWV